MLYSISSSTLLDIGSSTVKVYLYSSNNLKLLSTNSIKFKEGFSPSKGISEDNKKQLFDLVFGIKKEFGNNSSIKTYATELFRHLTPKARVLFVDEFFKETKTYFNIIDRDLENFYLEKALIGNCNLKEPVLLINVGGGSTELVIVKNGETLDRKNINLGVGTINTKFIDINAQISGARLTSVIGFIKTRLPKLKVKAKVGIYTGGELTYMKLVKYPLVKNELFNDKDHPFMISYKNFSSKNRQVFEKMTLHQLELLMPDNPNWMHGARGCSAITQAICEQYGIRTIIPSDSNLINGVVRQEFRKVTLSGSFRKYLDYIFKVKRKLEKSGAVVLSPRFSKPKNPGEEFVVFTGEEEKSPLELERRHMDAIAGSDALIVCDPEGYVGASALIEIGYANNKGKRIIFTEEPEEFMLQTLPAEVGILGYL